MCLFVCLFGGDNSITFTNCGGPCLALGILKKPLTRWCALVSLDNFHTNKAKVTKFKVIFIFENETKTNLLRFHKSSEIKPTSIGIVLGLVTLQEVWPMAQVP
jgi:hypothetical protein